MPGMATRHNTTKAMKANRDTHAGEYLMTVFVAVVLAAISIPSYLYYQRSHHAVAMSMQFIDSLNIARKHAMKLGGSVSVCAASDPSLQNCGDASDWHNGWIVFVDPDSDGVINQSSDRLQVQQALPSGSEIITKTPHVIYDSLGYSALGKTEFQLHVANCTGQHGRLVMVSGSGYLQVVASEC